MRSRGFADALRRAVAERRGATSLEFALAASVLFALLLGSIDLCRYLMTGAALRTVAADAARQATVVGGANVNAGRSPCTGLAGEMTGVTAHAPQLRPAMLTVSLSGCTSLGAATTVLVTAAYQFRFVASVMGAPVRQIREQAVAVFY